MIKTFISTIKNILGDNLLTLSGEVLVTPKKGFSRNALDCLDKCKLKCILDDINRKYPCFKVEIVNGLMEINIKFFAHKARIANKDFLNEFNEYLSGIASVILQQEKVSVRINVFGTLETKNKIEQYRYLNKKDDVRYTIVDEKVKNKFIRFLSPKIYLLTVLLFIACYAGYNHYFVDGAKGEAIDIDSRVVGSGYSASDLYNSWNRLCIRGTLGSSVLSLYSSITGNADQNRLTAMLDTNMGFQYADMWNRIASGNTMSKEQAMGDMYAWLKGSTTRKDIEKVFSEYEENGTAADPLRAAADLFINKGNGVMATQADAMYAALREKNVFSTDSLRQVFGDQFVKDNVAGGRIAGTADFIASGYGSDSNVRKRAEKYVQQLRSQGINITVDQYLGGVGLTYAKDTNRNQSNLSKVMVSGKLDRVKEFAMPFASQFGAERYANLVLGTEWFDKGRK